MKVRQLVLSINDISFLPTFFFLMPGPHRPTRPLPFWISSFLWANRVTLGLVRAMVHWAKAWHSTNLRPLPSLWPLPSSLQAVRDIWTRKTWAYETMPLWRNQVEGAARAEGGRDGEREGGRASFQQQHKQPQQPWVKHGCRYRVL